MGAMKTHIPAGTEVRDRLLGLNHAQTQVLAHISGVPFTTLWKIRNGDTTDPRIETVKKLYANLDDPKLKRFKKKRVGIELDPVQGT